MSEGFYDELGQLIDRHRQADQAAEEKKSSDERFDALNTKLDTLVDTVTQFVKGSGAPSEPPDGSTGAAGDPPAGGVVDPPSPNPPVPPPPELPVEVVTRLPVPRIYTGDDEPTEVRYIDPETGEEKTRAGRRKNYPAAYSVEPFEPEPPQE